MGEMFDFLRSNTWCDKHTFLWELTIPQIKIISSDFYHTESLATEEEKEKRYKEQQMISLIPEV